MHTTINLCLEIMTTWYGSEAKWGPPSHALWATGFQFLQFCGRLFRVALGTEYVPFRCFYPPALMVLSPFQFHLVYISAPTMQVKGWTATCISWLILFTYLGFTSIYPRRCLSSVGAGRGVPFNIVWDQAPRTEQTLQKHKPKRLRLIQRSSNAPSLPICMRTRLTEPNKLWKSPSD
jgi:hypothetical protein